MANSRGSPTAADAATMALSPLLIMGLVGSLVFFLAEVLYAGRYQDRLLYTLFFFVFGAVLVGRVAVTVDRKRAWAYGGFLAIVTLIALHVWVEFPEDSPLARGSDFVNAILVGVVWWSSNRLVRDCTFVDDNRTGSGKGLLAAAGWERRPEVRTDVVDDLEEDERQYKPGVAGWYQRYDQWRQSRSKRPHTPGLTVVYFSLAALPIFGLGQALVPADDAARRAFTFRLAAVYVGCGLGLLLTTSFLGLRRYLRQRSLRMPATMTASWMGLGGLLIVAFVVIGALIPRPYSESPIWRPRQAMTQERDASNNAVNRDGAGKGEGRDGNQSAKGDGDASAKGGEPGGKGKSGDAKTGDGEKKGEGNDGKDRKGEPAGGQKEGREVEGGRKDGSGNKSSSPPPSGGMRALSSIAGVVKWIVFAVVGLVILFVVFRQGLRFLSNFMPWARNLLAAIDAWLKGLWGGKEKTATGSGTAASEMSTEDRLSFSMFSDPFRDGTAAGRSPQDLVRYSFEALEGWANDRDRGRRGDETPLEFAARIGDEFTDLRPGARDVALLVARMAYSTGNLHRNALDSLRDFWLELTGVGAVEPRSSKRERSGAA